MTRIALVLALASGCSVALQSKPSARAGVASASCSSSGLHWKLDAAGVALAVAGVVAGFVMNADELDKSTGNIVSGASGLVAIGYTASMGNGIRWTNECRGQQSASMTASR